MTYATGLVVGKFCPLHVGHEKVINAALSDCEKVIILSYTSKNFPGCETEKRREWLTSAFPSATVVVLEPKDVPDDDMPDDLHRLFCANYLLNKMNTTVQAVYTSEEYGDGFAAYLSKFFTKELHTEVNVDHILVDKDREQFPISGTALRKNMDRKWLNHYVARDFIPRIAFLGGESSGKTTLARELSFRSEMDWVAEYGREWYDYRNCKLNYEDMEFIARNQIDRERCYSIRDYLFCDTTPLTTMFYSEQMFGRVAPALRKMAEREYHKIYLCDPNIDFEQDGTRREQSFRMVGHNWYVNYFKDNNIDYTVVSGTVEERINFVMKDLGL